MDCKGCAKRETCKTLCKDVEAYADQDHVNQREATFNQLGCDESQLDANLYPFDRLNLSTKFMVIKLYFINHISIPEIADMLYISRQYAYKIVKQYTPAIKKIRRKKPLT